LPGCFNFSNEDVIAILWRINFGKSFAVLIPRASTQTPCLENLLDNHHHLLRIGSLDRWNYLPNSKDLPGLLHSIILAAIFIIALLISNSTFAFRLFTHFL
jgi:hypothetical protein